MAFNTFGPALSNIQSGHLRALAVAGRARSGLLSDVPSEGGLPGFDAAVRYGLLAPVGTPRPIIARINTELRTIVSADETRSRIAPLGGEPLIRTPEEYAAGIEREQAKWGVLIKKLGLRVE